MSSDAYVLTEDETAEIKRVLALDAVRLILAPLVSQSGDYNECMEAVANMCWEQVKAPVHRQKVERDVASRQLERTEKWSFALGQPSNEKSWKENVAASRAYIVVRTVMTHMAGYYPKTFSAEQLFAEVGDQLPRLPASDYLPMLRLYEHLGLVVQDPDPAQPGEERFRAQQPTIVVPPEQVGALLERSRNFFRLVGPLAESALRQQGDVMAVMGRARASKVEALRQRVIQLVRPVIVEFVAENCNTPESIDYVPWGFAAGIGQLFAAPRDVQKENQDLPRPKRGGLKRQRR